MGYGTSPEAAIMGAVELAQTTIQLVSMGFVVWGATKMRRLESYGFAMSASVLMMLPWTLPCCLLGLPFGIWAVTALNREDVKEAFQRNSGEPQGASDGRKKERFLLPPVAHAPGSPQTIDDSRSRFARGSEGSGAMPEIVNCPQCERKLRVPDELWAKPLSARVAAGTSLPARLPWSIRRPSPFRHQLNRRYSRNATSYRPRRHRPLRSRGPIRNPTSAGWAIMRPRPNGGGWRRRQTAMAAVAARPRRWWPPVLGAPSAQVLYGIAQLSVVVFGPKTRRSQPSRGRRNRYAKCSEWRKRSPRSSPWAASHRDGPRIVCIIGTQKMKRLESYGWAWPPASL